MHSKGRKTCAVHHDDDDDDDDAGRQAGRQAEARSEGRHPSQTRMNEEENKHIVFAIKRVSGRTTSTEHLHDGWSNARWSNAHHQPSYMYRYTYRYIHTCTRVRVHTDIHS